MYFKTILFLYIVSTEKISQTNELLNKVFTFTFITCLLLWVVYHCDDKDFYPYHRFIVLLISTAINIGMYADKTNKF